jgi:hypothetical protein
MSDKPNTVILSKPVTVIDKMITSVTLREPTGGDMERAGDPTNPLTFTRRLSEILANLPEGTMRDMAARDVMAINRRTAAFLADDPPSASSTPTTSAPAGGTIQDGPSA